MEYFSQNNFLIITVVSIIFLVIIVTILSLRRSKTNTQNDSSDYIKALNAYIEGDIDDAVKLFYRSVNQNTENIDAYIRLGDIFRKQDKIEKAIKIHRELLVRRNLSQDTKKQIYRSLVKDLVKAMYFDKALETVHQIFRIESRNIWAKKQELLIYESKQDWGNAFKTLKHLDRWEKIPKVNSKLALYKVEMASSIFKNLKEKDGRIQLREAIKLDPNCSSGYIFLGDSYVREERYSDAIKIWVDFVKHVPAQSHLVLYRLQEVLFAKGNYSEIENILIDLNEKVPNNIDVSTMLSDLKERKGDLNGAIRQCEGVLDIEPNSQLAKLKLIKLYSKNDNSDLALKTALELADHNNKAQKKYFCSICSYESFNPLWHCPECNSWNSFNL